MSVKRYDFGGLVFSVTYDFTKLERNFCRVAGLYQGQPRILTILQEHEGVTLSVLSTLCNIGMSSLSVSVNNLKRSGLIRKDGTGKNQKIFLTDLGRIKARSFHEQIDAFYAKLLEDLGPVESETLNTALLKFDNYIKDYNKCFEAKHGNKTK